VDEDEEVEDEGELLVLSYRRDRLHPMGMPGLLQPPGPADPIQRLALMMALMVLGMPQVYSCHVTTGCGAPLDADISEPRICPPVGSGREIGISAMKEELDTRQWERLPAVRCMAMQSSLSFMCGLDGWTRKVKYEKFRQPCGVQPAACWKALKNGRLKIGEMEYPATMNQTRSHVTGEEGCFGSCRSHAIALEEKWFRYSWRSWWKKIGSGGTQRRTRWPPGPGRRPPCSEMGKPFWRTGCGYGSQGITVPFWPELEEQTFP
jgi:hypothetical protein